ncbi:MAG: bifunctional 2-C-methyl-D-erythritol 4-phosphate cytidylyltransferase/2-C-methyl-D-erythritol 2,4-cyclodiphosphate synthase [Siculibacillus sp.]|nr:bifunctional 2-C-methyl-D-erythritol 4-phosphate cytidylyltransferase/2-C-methyl-D-erythritol 2,4-cyclodiphosphate synthase [Siculibacillus sp.]
METRVRVAAIVVAGGTGTRAAGADGVPKQYRAVAGRAILAHTLGRFLDHPEIDFVITVIHPDHRDLHDAAVAELSGDPRLLAPAVGGATRQASVRAGLAALAALDPDLVLVHDAARPFVSAAILDRTVAALAESEAVLVAVPVVDTLKRADGEGRVADTVSRERMWAAQTPQGFRYRPLAAAHARAAAEGRDDFTDDSAVAEWAGLSVRLVEGERANVKITTAEDLAAAEERMTIERFARLCDVRVGTGYDVHAFEPGDHVTLCGVKIPHSARLNGHSDADVPLHALTDAILGALGDGDIGAHFPPSDMRWRGCDSAVFVRDAIRRVKERGGMLAHVDITLVAEAPKIGPHREVMRSRVAEICEISVDRVGVKATTNEKLGFVGRREGIAALATATVRLPFSSTESPERERTCSDSQPMPAGPRG